MEHNPCLEHSIIHVGLSISMRVVCMVSRCKKKKGGACRSIRCHARRLREKPTRVRIYVQ